MNSHSNYVGRFAPSPTGPLHFGSLVAALASFLDARFNRGKWLVRIEDLDPPREQQGADILILKALENLSLTWDDSILYQSQRQEAYANALTQLSHNNQLYPCLCSRKKIGRIYKNHCRSRSFSETPSPFAVRLIVDSGTVIRFVDKVCGHQQEHLDRTCGDFIVKRKDELIAYQLAVSVDDDYQNITHVIRGADLLDSTFRQIHLQHQLGFQTPVYGHVSMITDHEGNKLSKQTHAPALDPDSASRSLHAALQVLQQNPPKQLVSASPEEIVSWAIEHWRIDQVSREPIHVPGN
jgi:glutamyl-Q tRNA(Asp) synthetase